MRDVRRFETGQLFGIKVRDNSVRTGIKVATLGRYDRTRNGFVVNMISSEGVAGSNQALRFQNRADAQRWIYANCAAFGYEAEDMQVMNTAGSAETSQSLARLRRHTLMLHSVKQASNWFPQPK